MGLHAFDHWPTGGADEGCKRTVTESPASCGTECALRDSLDKAFAQQCPRRRESNFTKCCCDLVRHRPTQCTQQGMLHRAGAEVAAHGATDRRAGSSAAQRRSGPAAGVVACRDRVADLQGFLDEVPAGIGMRERVVSDVGVAIEPLGRFRKLHERIRRQEPPDFGVIHPPAHVHQADMVDVLVHGEAAALPACGDKYACIRGLPCSCGPALTPGIVGQRLGDAAGFTRDRDHGALVIPMEVARGVGDAGPGASHHRHRLTVGLHVVGVLDFRAHDASLVKRAAIKREL